MGSGLRSLGQRKLRTGFQDGENVFVSRTDVAQVQGLVDPAPGRHAHHHAASEQDPVGGGERMSIEVDGRAEVVRE